MSESNLPIISPTVEGFGNYEAKVLRAVQFVNKTLRGTQLYEAIAAHEDGFILSKEQGKAITGPRLASILQGYVEKAQPYRIYVKPYRGGRNVLAYVSPKDKHRINLNTRNLNRTTGSVAGTIMHELLHLIDYQHPAYFGHGSNSAKASTAPYWIGRQVEKLYNKHSPKTSCRSVEKRLWYAPWQKRRLVICD